MTDRVARTPLLALTAFANNIVWPEASEIDIDPSTFDGMDWRGKANSTGLYFLQFLKPFCQHM